MLRAHLSPVERLCEARLTKRSTSEVGLGATVVGVSLIGKPSIFFPATLCPARNMAGCECASQTRHREKLKQCLCADATYAVWPTVRRRSAKECLHSINW